MNGTDKDLAAHFTIINKCGIVLYGAEIKDIFADVPRENYMDSICCDVQNAKEDILEDSVYIILNLCRVAAFLKNDAVLSKKQGGEWALQDLPSVYHSLVSRALKSYVQGDKMKINSEEAHLFAEYMLQMIRGDEHGKII